MRKQLFLSALLAAMLLPFGTTAQVELTVCDGDATGQYAPYYGWFNDCTSGAQNEFIYPASLLEEMVGGTITEMTFYCSSVDNGSTYTYTTPNMAIYLDESDDENYSTSSWKITEDAALVSTAVCSIVNGEWVITLEEPYTYNGGNLVFHVTHGHGTNCPRAIWYGIVPSDGANHNATCNSSDGSASAYAGILPKCTFTYTAGGNTICLRPNGLTVSDITSEGATVSWTPRGEETQWMVYVDGEYMTTVSETTYTISDLGAASNHTFGVAAVCSTDNVSGIATTTFRTACGVATLPYSEGFEDYASSSRPDCWSRLSGYSSYPYVSTSYSHTGSKAYYLCSSSTSQPNFVATPQFSVAPNQLHVVFWVRRGSSYYGTLEAGIMTDTTNQSTFLPILTISGGESSVWTEYEFYTDTVSLEGESCYVAFRWTDNYGYACYLDDVDVEVASNCRRPENAQVSSPTYEGATVSWTDLGTAATSYTVRVATTNNINATDYQEFEASGSPYTITGLNSSTTYYAWVATTCGETQTLWRYAGSFTTEQDCYPVQNLTVADRNMTTALITWDYQARGRDNTGVLVTVIDQSVSPADTIINAQEATGNHYYIEGLEGGHTYTVRVYTQCDEYTSTYNYTSIDIPACGRMQGTSTTSYAPTYNGYSARNSFTMSLYPASLVENLSEVSGLQWRISSTPSGGYNRQVKVWLGNTDATALTTTSHPSIEDMTLVYEGNLNLLNSGWVTVEFEEGWQSNGDNVVVAVLCNSGESSGVTWGATYGSSNSTVYWYTSSASTQIDPENLTSSISSSTSYYMSDITFMGDCQQPDCLAPLASFEGSTTNSVSLVWHAGNAESNWTVEYRPYGETEWTTFAASTSTAFATVTGLEASTLYEFRVGSLCSDSTLYSTIVRGRTECDAITLPFTDSFEGWTGSYPFPSCWTKVLANGNYPYIYNASSTSNSYVHNGLGCMYAYGSASNPNLFASPAVPTTPDNIKVTFWARGYSTTNANMQAGVMTDLTDPTTFVPCTVVATGLTYSAGTGYSSSTLYEYEFYTDNVTATGTPYVAFRFANSDGVYIDDVTIAEAGTCRKPNTPSRDNISYYSVSLHWNDVNQGTVTYEVRYSTVNDVETDGYVSLQATGDGLDLTGLQNGQTYYAWVRPTCSTSSDDWLPIPSFTTLVSCYSVTNVAVDAKTHTTASIRWTYSTNGMPAQGVLLTLKDNTDNTSVVSDLYETAAGHIFTGLTDGHGYTLYLSTICNPDTSAALSFNFSTEATSCGEEVGTTSDSSYSYPLSTYYNYSYSQSLYPASSVGDMTTITGISLRVAKNTLARTIDVYMANTEQTSLGRNSAIAADDFTLVAENVSFSPAETGWFSISFDTPFNTDGSNVVVALNDHTGSYSNYNYIWLGIHATTDTMTIYARNDSYAYNPSSTVPTMNNGIDKVADIRFSGNCTLETPCSAPVLTITDVATTSVGLQWAADVATSFQVEYRTTGSSEWTVYATGVEGTTYTVEDLEASTQYDFRVGSLCDENNTLYSTTKTTYTECDLQAVPVTYTFTEALTPCWTLTSSNVYRYTSGNALYWTSGISSIGRAVLPETAEPVSSLMAVIRARYSSYSGTNYNLLVGVGNSQGNNVVWVDTLVLTTTYADYEVYFDNYTGTDNRIVLSKDGYNYIYVEQIDLALNNGCRPVENLTVSDIAANSATISWTAMGSETQWLVSLNGVEHGVATTTTYSLSSLEAATGYTVTVQALCSETDTSRQAFARFQTPCDGSISELPWTEDFNSVTPAVYDQPGEMPACWDAESDASTKPLPHVSLTGGYHYSPDNTASLVMTAGASTNGWANNAIAILPAFAFQTNTLQLHFWMATEQYGSGYGTLYVGYIDNNGNFVEVETIVASSTTYHSNGGTEQTVSFASVPSGNYRMAFKWSLTSSYYSVCIDNVTVSAIGDDPNPQPVQYNVSVLSANNAMGTVSSTHSGLVNAGTSVTATATPNQGYRFVNWTDLNGTVVSTANPYTFSVSADVDIEAKFEQSVGIDEANANAISLYPNPATSSVTIAGIAGKAAIEVVDMNGRQVMTAEAEQTATLDISTLAKGAYFVRVTSAAGTAVSKLVVK